MAFAKPKLQRVQGMYFCFPSFGIVFSFFFASASIVCFLVKPVILEVISELLLSEE